MTTTTTTVVTGSDDSPSRREQLLALLADGTCHSGERLAEQLHITRAAVWKLVNTLRELGVDIHSQHHGYQLPQAVELYNAAWLRSTLSSEDVELHVLFAVDSTNRHVNQLTIQADHPVLCVAEIQQAGRGRRGRSWLAPFGSGLCMSLGYLFEALPPGVSALSLVVGVALVRVLHRHGATEAGLKWPNDIWWRGRKLAGVLIEMRGEPDGAAQMVIGIGMNVRLPDRARQSLAAQQVEVCDLHDLLGDAALLRNQWVAAFAQELLVCIRQFAREGFAPFHAEWQRYDVLREMPVQISNGQHKIAGTAHGVSEDGSLLLQTEHGVQRFVAGEVSLRPQDHPLTSSTHLV